MSAAFPKLRQDLIISRQETDRGVTFILKDPLTGDFFRFRAPEHFIAVQCDGVTPPEVIRQRTETKFDAKLPDEAFYSFLRHLEKARLLESPSSTRSAVKPRKRIQGDILNARVRLLNPAGLLRRLDERLWFLFTSVFVAIASALILLAAWFMIENWDIYVSDLPRLYSFSALVPALLLSFVLITAHEFGHGLTCTHFGGEVREMGFLYIYFRPAFYCNVSDAWLFPERSRRLWVSFAGPFFEAFLWSIATLTWYVTEPDTWINYWSLIVMTMSGVNILVNFNPLIKLDGYYLLSDFLGVPNLRRKSFRYIGELMKRLTGKHPSSTLELLPSERLILLAYGSVATVFSFWLLGFTFINMATFLLDNDQPGPLLFLVATAGFRLRDRFARLFGRKAKPLAKKEIARVNERQSRPACADAPPVRAVAVAEPQAKPAAVPAAESPARVAVKVAAPPANLPVPAEAAPLEPASAAGVAAPKEETPAKPSRDREAEKKEKEREKKHRQLVRKRIAFAAAGVLALGIITFGSTELKIGGPFVILPIHNVDIRSEIDGTIDELYVTEGDSVKPGQLLATLSARENKAELEKVQAQIQQVTARLKMLQVGPRREEIEVARAAVQKAKDRLRFARLRLTRDKPLFEKAVISLTEYENEQEQTATAQSDLEEAQEKLRLMEKGSRPEEIEAAQAEIASLVAQQHHLEQLIQLASLSSPVAGIVATPARQLEALQHQAMKKGSLVLKVFDFKKLTVQIAVSEKDIADIKVGGDVVFKARAFPDETFLGTVVSTATVAMNSSSTSETPVPDVSGATVSPSTILVTTEIDNSAYRLKPGMTGQAKILCGDKTVFQLIARRVARVVKVEFWSWW